MFKFDYSILMEDLFKYMKTPNVISVKDTKKFNKATKVVEMKKETFFNNQTYTTKFDLDLIEISKFKDQSKYKKYFSSINPIESGKLYRIH